MGKTPSRKNLAYWNNGDYEWVSIKDLGSYDRYVGHTKETISELGRKEAGIKAVPANTLLMSFKLSLGKTAITTKPTYTNEAIMAFLDKGLHQFDLGYMWHQFRSKDWAAGTNTAVMGKTLNKQTLGAAIIKLPPLSDQISIAEHLDKVCGQLQLANREVSKLDQLVKSRFVEMFGDLCDGEFNYEPQPLFKLCKAFVGGGTPSMKHPEYYGGSIPFVKSGDVKARVITEGALSLTEAGLNNSSAKLIPAGSLIIVTRSGILKHTLPVAITGCTVAINQDLKAIVLNPETKPEYLQWALLVLEPLILSKVRSTTADNIETKLIKNLEIPIPPLKAQQEFADFVAQVDKSRFVYICAKNCLVYMACKPLNDLPIDLHNTVIRFFFSEPAMPSSLFWDDANFGGCFLF